MTSIVPYDQGSNGATGEVGIVESWRLRGEARRANADIARRTRDAYLREIVDQLDQGRAVREEQRRAERTEVGLELSSGIFDCLVDHSGGDEAKARFLLPVATAGRDAIMREIR